MFALHKDCTYDVANISVGERNALLSVLEKVNEATVYLRLTDEEVVAARELAAALYDV